MERITDARADSARVKGARATGAAESRLGRALAEFVAGRAHG